MLEIINQKYMFLLFEIAKKERSVLELSKKADLTSSVTSIIISRWAKQNVITKKKSGKGNELVVLLTDYGKEQVILLRRLWKNYKLNKEGKFGKKEVKDGGAENN